MRRLYLYLEGALLLALANGNNNTQWVKQNLSCPPGFYCPSEGFIPVPCPKGTYGPTIAAVSADSCLQCPPHHYCPEPGLPAPKACGPVAHQPLSGQESCTCLGEGQNFQTSDGQCHCTIGYQPFNNGDECARKVYGVCKNGKTRTQHGDCWDSYQWLLHCRGQVCQSAEDYRAYDPELGLCVCREPPLVASSCTAGQCRRGQGAELMLKCLSSGELQLVWSDVLTLSGNVLETVFKHLVQPKILLCSRHLSSSHAVHLVQTTDAGFLGLLGGLPKELQQHFIRSSAGGFTAKAWGVPTVSGGLGDVNSSGRTRSAGDVDEPLKGIPNPTVCLQLGDVVLFTISSLHYPEYDLDNLYNTNSDFDWGAFRQLKEEMTLSWTPPSFFSLVFSHPGVYVFKLSSSQHKHMYVRVMPAGVQCFESGPFFPSTPRHVTRLGIRRRRNLLLRPDWLVTGGLLAGAVVILCICVTLLLLFREYGWPEKRQVCVRYRSLQSAFHMEDYSSKGSMVTSQRKIHRNQQARMSADSTQPGLDGIETTATPTRALTRPSRAVV